MISIVRGVRLNERWRVDFADETRGLLRNVCVALGDRNSQVIVILDEDEAGKAGREDIAVRLAKFCFVKTHVFDQPDTQPDQLSEENMAEILGSAP